MKDFELGTRSWVKVPGNMPIVKQLTKLSVDSQLDRDTYTK